MGVSPLDHPAHRPGGGRALLYGGLVRQHTRGLGPSSTRGARPPRGVVGLLPFPLARPSTPGGRVRSHSRPPGVFPAWARGSIPGRGLRHHAQGACEPRRVVPNSRVALAASWGVPRLGPRLLPGRGLRHHAQGACEPRRVVSNSPPTPGSLGLFYLAALGPGLSMGTCGGPPLGPVS
jgi:hypothetical protein